MGVKFQVMRGWHANSSPTDVENYRQLNKKRSVDMQLSPPSNLYRQRWPEDPPEWQGDIFTTDNPEEIELCRRNPDKFRPLTVDSVTMLDYSAFEALKQENARLRAQSRRGQVAHGEYQEVPEDYLPAGGPALVMPGIGPGVGLAEAQQQLESDRLHEANAEIARLRALVGTTPESKQANVPFQQPNVNVPQFATPSDTPASSHTAGQTTEPIKPPPADPRWSKLKELSLKDLVALAQEEEITVTKQDQGNRDRVLAVLQANSPLVRRT